MPDLGSATFSQTDASNATGTMPSWSGSALPSTIDDAGRALQGAITREWNWRNPTITSTGSGNAHVLTYSVAPAALYNGQTYTWIAGYTNTGAATLNINSLGAKSIKKIVAGTAVAIAPGDISVAQIVTTFYNSAADAFLLATSGDSQSATGAVIPFAGTVAPTGWIFSYGQAISRTTYAALFAVIGTTYGSGDGSTTFNLPDLRGRAIAGKDDMGGTSANRLTGLTGGVDGDVLGGTGGAETHTLTTAEIAAHQHFIATNISTSSGSPSLGAGEYVVKANSTGSNPGYTFEGSSTEASVGLTSSTGGGGTHNNVQPTFILNYIIKT